MLYSKRTVRKIVFTHLTYIDKIKPVMCYNPPLIKNKKSLTRRFEGPVTRMLTN